MSFLKILKDFEVEIGQKKMFNFFLPDRFWAYKRWAYKR